ncbi:hypothetical protein QZH41_019878, partial [Actinostola sp. cb2023]
SLGIVEAQRNDEKEQNTGKSRLSKRGSSKSSESDSTGSSTSSILEVCPGSDSDVLNLASWGLPPSVLQRYNDMGITHMFEWQAECLRTGNVLRGGRVLILHNYVHKKVIFIISTISIIIVISTTTTTIIIITIIIISITTIIIIIISITTIIIIIISITTIIIIISITTIIIIIISIPTIIIISITTIIHHYLHHHHHHHILTTIIITFVIIIIITTTIIHCVTTIIIITTTIIIIHIIIISIAITNILLLGFVIIITTTIIIIIYICYIFQKSYVHIFSEIYIATEPPIQIVCMSATLPNLDMLARWLAADVYFTDHRPVPLTEMVKVGPTIYDNTMKKIRDIDMTTAVANDNDHVIPLCKETITGGHSVLIFCPTKNWCEKQAEAIARHFATIGNAALARKSDNSSHKSGFVKASDLIAFDYEGIREVFEQLKRTPVGLDSVLRRVIPYSVAYHHAGLTVDERDIIEGAFRQGTIRILVATSTLCSGVNLPARRVIIRTPTFHGKMIDPLVYKQMAGRAGRKGVDELGESILVCKTTERHKATTLMKSELKPVQSCLLYYFFSKQVKEMNGGMKRALLEVISSGVVTGMRDVERYSACTFFASSSHESDTDGTKCVITDTIKFLVDNEFIRVQVTKDKKADEDKVRLCGHVLRDAHKEPNIIHLCAQHREPSTRALLVKLSLLFTNILTKPFQESEAASSHERYVPTQLGAATVASALSPDEALVVFGDLQQARKCFVLESELHIMYQVTPIYVETQWPNLDWNQFLSIWERLPSHMRRVADIVGIQEVYLSLASRGRIPTRTPQQRQQLRVHRRFFAALALQDLVHEVPLNVVATRYGATRGMVQSLQSSASTFAGMVTVFCQKLGWINLDLLLSQFQSRLSFGVERELCDLVRISVLNAARARMLYTAGFQTTASLASAKPEDVETVLRNAAPFVSERKHHGETDVEVRHRNEARVIWVAGKRGLSEKEAAVLIVTEAKQHLKDDVAQLGIHWKATVPEVSIPEVSIPEVPGTSIGLKGQGTLSRDKDTTGKKRRYSNRRKLSGSYRQRKSPPLRRSSRSPNNNELPVSKAKDEEDRRETTVTTARMRDIEKHSLVTKGSDGMSDLGSGKDVAIIDYKAQKSNALSTCLDGKKKGVTEVNMVSEAGRAGLCQKQPLQKDQERLTRGDDMRPPDVNVNNAKTQQGRFNNPSCSNTAYETTKLKEKRDVSTVNGGKDNVASRVNRTSGQLYFQLKQVNNTHDQHHDSLITNNKKEFHLNDRNHKPVNLFTRDKVSTNQSRDRLLHDQSEAAKSRGGFPVEENQKRNADEEKGNGFQVGKDEIGNNLLDRRDETKTTLCSLNTGANFTSTVERTQRCSTRNSASSATSVAKRRSPRNERRSDSPKEKFPRREVPAKAQEQATTDPKKQDSLLNTTRSFSFQEDSCSSAVLFDNSMDTSENKVAPGPNVSPELYSEPLDEERANPQSNVGDGEESLGYSMSDSYLAQCGGFTQINSEVHHSEQLEFDGISSISDDIIAQHCDVILQEIDSKRNTRRRSNSPEFVDQNDPFQKKANSQEKFQEGNFQEVKHQEENCQDININKWKRNRHPKDKDHEIGNVDEDIVGEFDSGGRFQTGVSVSGHLTGPCSPVTPSNETSSPGSLVIDSEASPSCTYTSVVIVDVSANELLFHHFIKEWKVRKEFSLSLGCERVLDNVPKIGGCFNKGPMIKHSPTLKGLAIDGTDEAVVGLAVCWGGRDAYYISLRESGHVTEGTGCLDESVVASNLSVSARLEGIKAVLEYKGKRKGMKFCFDSTTQYKVLAQSSGITLSGEVEDPKVAAWLLDPTAKERSLHHLAAEYISDKTELLEGTGAVLGCGSLGLASQSPMSGRARSSTEAVVTYWLMKQLRLDLNKVGLDRAFYQVEMPVMKCLARMELNGIGFSEDECERLKLILQTKLRSLEETAYKLANHSFSLTSPDDVATVLFMELRLPVDGKLEENNATKRRTLGSTRRVPAAKRGRKQLNHLSTNKEILERLKTFHPLPGVVLEWRRVNCALTKVVYPVQRQNMFNPRVNMKRIYTTSQIHTATGRVSFAEPNLQNVPRDFEIDLPTSASTIPPQGAQRMNRASDSKFSVSMRTTFIPFEGGVMLAADYSQLELRLIAHLSGDERLLKLLNTGGDVFKMIAGSLNGVEPAAVSDVQRQQAKQICYGIIYGIGAKSLGEQLVVSEEDASVFIEKFKSRFSGIKEVSKNN